VKTNQTIVVHKKLSMEKLGSIRMAIKKCNTCKREIDELQFVGSQCKQCHSDYLESLGGED
jgi:Zn finger protein HypA/HybF involved in hydrogenase expression